EGALNRPLMYGALTFESLTQGMGTGAFAVLLLRLTQKRFSATQYALFSSLIGLPRLLAAPMSGRVVYAVGRQVFVSGTVAAGFPGLVLLHRFAPLGVREPALHGEAPRTLPRLSSAALILRGLGGGMAGILVAVFVLEFLAGLRAMKTTPAGELHLLQSLGAMIQPSGVGDWIQIVGIVVFGTITGLLTAALSAARRA